MCRDELGFRYVGCHGILSDRMDVVRPDGSFDFTRAQQVLDAIMESGLMPFLNLTTSPRIAEARIGGAPARDGGAWYELVRALITLIDGRYGCDAREWYFELGYEPGLSCGSGTPEGYLRLYDVTARAIKE